MAGATFDPQVGGDGSTVTDDDNANTGLKNGGARTRLVPAFAQIVAIAIWLKTFATAKLQAMNELFTTLNQRMDQVAASAAALPNTTATSITSLLIGTGIRTLATQAGKAIIAGMSLRLSSTAMPANYMIGLVTAYDSATGALTIDVTESNGDGLTVAAWSLSTAPQAFNGTKDLRGGSLLNIKNATLAAEPTTGTTGGVAGVATAGTINIDWREGHCQRQLEPTAAITYTMTPPIGRTHLQMRVESDGTSVAVAFTWPANWKWLGQPWAPVANKAGFINAWWDGTNYWAMGVNEV